jgi:hypothetical protein
MRPPDRPWVSAPLGRPRTSQSLSGSEGAIIREAGFETVGGLLSFGLDIPRQEARPEWELPGGIAEEMNQGGQVGKSQPRDLSTQRGEG